MRAGNIGRYKKPDYEEVVLLFLIFGIISFVISIYLVSSYDIPCGLSLFFFSIVLFLPAYWVYIKKPQIIRREQDESRMRRQEDERRRQEELRRKYGDLFLSVVDAIKAFKPLLPDYPNELPYHVDLARWLEPKFPMLRVEEQIGSARPDIVIEDIAIEIKGPTHEDGLRSIADKCLRYSLYFEKGLIIVLFDVKVTSRYIDDLKKGLQNKFPHVVIRW